MTRPIIIGALVLAACHASFAQQPRPKPWEQEPSTVGGVPLGRPISELPACGKSYASTTLCAREPLFGQSKFREIDGFPSLGITAWGHMALLHDGMIVTLSFQSQHFNWDALKAVLVERYGPPHSKASNVVTTRGGARLSSESLTWSGTRTLIVAEERNGKIDECGVFFTDRVSSQLAQDQKARDAKDNAGKL